MARTESNMLELGTEAPGFTLPNRNPDHGGELVSLEDFAAAPALLVVFMCNHCPYVVHLKQSLAERVREWQQRGLAAVAISANDVSGYPQDGPEAMSGDAREHRYSFPYLYDEDQHVAHAYRAACTPDFFLFDGERRLVYRGQYDASRPRNDEPVTGADLAVAVDAVLDGRPAPAEQVPSMGCNIKWKPGNEPGADHA